jgi:hypothetical protein
MIELVTRYRWSIAWVLYILYLIFVFWFVEAVR